MKFLSLFISFCDFLPRDDIHSPLSSFHNNYSDNTLYNIRSRADKIKRNNRNRCISAKHERKWYRKHPYIEAVKQKGDKRFPTRTNRKIAGIHKRLKRHTDCHYQNKLSCHFLYICSRSINFWKKWSNTAK